jgi:hypothetical protein
MHPKATAEARTKAAPVLMAMRLTRPTVRFNWKF